MWWAIMSAVSFSSRDEVPPAVVAHGTAVADAYCEALMGVPAMVFARLLSTVQVDSDDAQ
jgi:hypothetical protein